MSGSNLSGDHAQTDGATASSKPQVPNDHLLGMTVHSLPELDEALADQRIRKGRLKMLVVMLVCAAPVVASYFTYYVIRPDGRTNFGDLITPARSIPQMKTHSLKQVAGELPELKGQWLLISVASGDCSKQCQEHLYFQRQMRESLGREKDRLDWVWLIPDGAEVPSAISKALDQATVLRVSNADLSEWLQPAAGFQLQDHLYVVDPLGNWMLRFPANMGKSDAAKAKKDLERLLRASSSWDQPGRGDGS
jgi:hypothetical protein